MLRSMSRAGWTPDANSARVSALAQPPVLHQQEILDQHALVLDAPAVGRHGAGRDPADVGMVPARGGEEGGPAVAIEDHRRDHRDVRQVRAAGMRRVQHVDVAGAYAASVG